MEQNIGSISYFSKEFEERLRILNPINRLFYMCLTASRMEDDSVEMAALSVDISNLIYELRETYSLNHYNEIIKNQSSLINKNTEILTASALLTGPETWKEIIKYELSIIPITDRDQELRKMLGCLRDLTFRIDNNHIFNVFELMLCFDRVSEFSNEEGNSKDTVDPSKPLDFLDLIKSEEFLVNDILDEGGYGYINSLSKNNFDLPIKNYIDYLENLNLDNLKIENPEYLLRRMKILERRENEKIEIEKKPKLIIKGLTYLLSKCNPNLEKSYLSTFSAKVVHSIFATTKIPNSDNFPDIKLEPSLLVDYLIFLIKYSYVKHTKRPGIPMILSRQINFELSGGQSYQTLNRLFNERLPVLEKNSSLKLSFNGLSNEIALRNEMIY